MIYDIFYYILFRHQNRNLINHSLEYIDNILESYRNYFARTCAFSLQKTDPIADLQEYDYSQATALDTLLKSAFLLLSLHAISRLCPLGQSSLIDALEVVVLDNGHSLLSVVSTEDKNALATQQERVHIGDADACLAE